MPAHLYPPISVFFPDLEIHKISFVNFKQYSLFECTVVDENHARKDSSEAFYTAKSAFTT